MATLMPPQGVVYRGRITNTDRWADFQHRPDDIFVCTPPKCGTTWTQAICAMLVFGRVDHGQQTGVISPWIDAEFAPIEDYLVKVEAQTHRRYIKTHTPFDGIPYYPECAYLAVFRDPRDAFLSGLDHRDNMTDQDLATSSFPHGPRAFDDWLTRVPEPGSWDVQSIHSFVHFFRTYWDYRDLPNVHLLHFSDMKRDTRGAIAQIAAAVDVPLDDALLDEMAAAASFANMKRNADQFAPESGTGLWKKEGDFFANGGARRWAGVLSDDQLAAFDARLLELLPDPAAARWLLDGGGVP